MSILQAAGVAAGIVRDCKGIQEDIQLQHRGYFQELNHPIVDNHTVARSPFVLSKTPAAIKTHAPCLGQDNEYVYTKLLGFSDSEFVELLSAGVFE